MMLTLGPTIWWAPGDDVIEAIHLGPTAGKLRHGLESFQWLMDVSIPVFKLLCNSNLMVFVFNPQLFVKIPIRVWKLLHLSKPHPIYVLAVPLMNYVFVRVDWWGHLLTQQVESWICFMDVTGRMYVIFMDVTGRMYVGGVNTILSHWAFHI